MVCENPNCYCKHKRPDPYWRFVVGGIIIVIGLIFAAYSVDRAFGQSANDACDLDFTNDGVVDNRDIEAFVRVYSEGPCAVLNDGSEDTLAPPCDDIDFNNDGSSFDPQDLDGFRLAYEGGPCPNGWYPIPKWNDQVRIWLAPSYGSDINSGYKREQAVATPLKAYMLVQQAVQANRPWAVVIPRGEIVAGRLTGEYGAWAHGGSGGKPGYIGADPDDDPSLPRPLFVANGGDGFLGYCGNLRLISLAFEGNDVGNGVRFFGKGSEGRTDIVISDVAVKNFAGGFALQGSDKQDPMKRVLVSRSSSKWCSQVGGHAQGSFASCVDGLVWDTVTLQQNGNADVFCHNYYGVSNCENVVWKNSIAVEGGATGWQCRGGKQDVSWCVAINNPLGVTFGHAQAEADDDATGSLTDSLVIGGGNIAGQPRSFSIGINRASSVTIKRNVIWREAPEGLDMETGAAFWLQGAEHQVWDVSDNFIYDPRMSLTRPTSAPLVRDDRPIGSTPLASSIATNNTLYTTAPGGVNRPYLSTYLNEQGVQVFQPEFAGRTFGEVATRNRRGAWNDAFTSKALNVWWRERMFGAE